jgi:hypothetical protein
VIRRAYAACNQAVQDELARFAVASNGNGKPKPRAAHEVVEVSTSPAFGGTRLTTTSSTPVGRTTPAPRPATASQVKAIRAIASRRRIDLPGLLQTRFGLMAPSELGIRQASELIDELKADGDDTAGPSDHGAANGTYAAKGGAR